MLNGNKKTEEKREKFFLSEKEGTFFFVSLEVLKQSTKFVKKLMNEILTRS